MAVEPESTLTVDVWRGGADGRFQTFQVPRRAHQTILDVVTAVAPIERIRKCPLGLSSHTELCPLHKELDQAFAATEAAFRRVTLKNLVESTSPIVPLCEVR